MKENYIKWDSGTLSGRGNTPWSVQRQKGTTGSLKVGKRVRRSGMERWESSRQSEQEV